MGGYIAGKRFCSTAESEAWNTHFGKDTNQRKLLDLIPALLQLGLLPLSLAIALTCLVVLRFAVFKQAVERDALFVATFLQSSREYSRSAEA